MAPNNRLQVTIGDQREDVALRKDMNQCAVHSSIRAKNKYIDHPQH